ncbi:ORF382 [White spot syndrome virus]|uniref:ORF382 n=1 Tax=White spot syndrome virus TaxID=342409 RepID=A0A2D3I5W4_9VIRU|nr:ORF382 [White spot syndrome virus]
MSNIEGVNRSLKHPPFLIWRVDSIAFLLFLPFDDETIQAQSVKNMRANTPPVPLFNKKSQHFLKIFVPLGATNLPCTGELKKELSK